LAEGPLSGIRVLDLTRLIPGPYCSLVLSDLGADVVKVEDPEAGDYLREVSPRMFAALNRGKRSIALDLKSDPEPLRTLCAAADVLVEGFRPGVLERLAPFVLQDFPRLVVCRISGFGQTGPRRDRAGHGIGYLALSGALETKFWERCCAAVGRPDWLDRALDTALTPLLDALFATRSRDEWDAALRAADCCGEPVLEVSELRSQTAFADLFVGEWLRSAPALVPTGSLSSRPAPRRGEHTAEVLREWASARPPRSAG